MFTALIGILAVAYIILKISNTRAEFARRDAENARRAAEAEERMEEELEEAEIRANAIDVEARIDDNTEGVFDVDLSAINARAADVMEETEVNA